VIEIQAILVTESVEQFEADVFDAVGVVIWAKQYKNLSSGGHQRVGRCRTTTESAHRSNTRHFCVTAVAAEASLCPGSRHPSTLISTILGLASVSNPAPCIGSPRSHETASALAPP